MSYLPPSPLARLGRRRKPDPLVEMTVAPLKPGDIVVLRFDTCLNLDHVNRLHAQMRESFPDNRVCVLSGGAKLSIIRPDGTTQDVPA